LQDSNIGQKKKRIRKKKVLLTGVPERPRGLLKEKRNASPAKKGAEEK